MRLHAFVLLAAALISLAGCGPSSSPSSSTSTSQDLVTGGDQSAVLAATTAAEPNTAVLQVNGMGCPLCANNVDQQLLAIKGVERVRIDLGSGQVHATLSPDNPPTRDQLAKAIDNSGFTLVKIEMPR